MSRFVLDYIDKRATRYQEEINDQENKKVYECRLIEYKLNSLPTIKLFNICHGTFLINNVVFYWVDFR